MVLPDGEFDDIRKMLGRRIPVLPPDQTKFVPSLKQLWLACSLTKVLG